jgi:hypothetical protein
MSEAARIAHDLFQYPPGDFRWRLWMVCEQINEAFVAARKAGMWSASISDPRGDWALDTLAVICSRVRGSGIAIRS